MTDISASQLAAPPPIRIDRLVVAVAAGVLIVGALWIGQQISLRQAVLFLVGGALGATLYHASFGFTGG